MSKEKFEFRKKEVSAEELEAFRQEIAAYAEEDGKTENKAHFAWLRDKGEQFKPEDLPTENFVFWTKVKKEAIKYEDFKKYRLWLKSLEKAGKKESPTRHGFFSLAGNIGNGIIWKREAEEIKKRKK